MTLSHQDIRKFQKMIFDWWAEHKRDLPWRHTHDPYKIMISEVMLQQTQVQRVLTKYVEFIKAYPTVQSLAQAKTADVLRIWKGMGYNRRALYLKRASEAVLEAHNGVFPASEDDLRKLSGIGQYTARAILVFSFKKDCAMVDTNIRKIITHFFFHDTKQPEKVIQDTADQLLPKGRSWQWHQALMDYGAANMKNLSISQSLCISRKVPFRDSNRFYRGRIMDLVREKKWKEKTLIQEMVIRHGKNVLFMKKILLSLVQDELVKQTDNIIQLPD